MTKLTVERIKEIASNKKVDSIVVENFLLSLCGEKGVDLTNLNLDAKTHHWTLETVQAIRQGIAEHYKPEETWYDEWKARSG